MSRAKNETLQSVKEQWITIKKRKKKNGIFTTWI